MNDLGFEEAVYHNAYDDKWSDPRVLAQGQDTFVEAALTLLQDNPSLRFVMVGDPEDEALVDRLRNRIAAAGQGDATRS